MNCPAGQSTTKGPGPTTTPPQGPHAEPPMDPGHLWPAGVTAQTRHAARPCGMASPWETCWLRLPVNFRQALAAEDITAEVNDARIYASLWNRHLAGHDTGISDAIQNVHRLNLLQRRGEDSTRPPTPTELQAMTAVLDRLYQVAAGTQRYSNTTTSMEAWMRRAMHPPPPAQISTETLPTDRRHNYRPRNPSDRAHRSQQETDAALKEKWTVRLLQALRPYPLPYLQANPDTAQQRRLLGRTKWTTLRTHALTLERTLKVTPDLLLWQEGETEMQRIQTFLDAMVQQGCKPSRLRSAWSTLNWVCKTTGYPIPSDHSGLQSSYHHAEDALTKVKYRERQHAHMPPDEVVQALETAACNPKRSPVYRYYASTLRLQLGVSARFVDMQHTAPSTLGVHSHHIDLAPWQTKTTHRGQPIETKYIATKHSRSNLDWWEAVATHSKTMVAAFPQMDFMYPRMDATKTKFVLQPATAAQVTRMYRHILACEGVPPATTNKMSLHGLRLWAAEMAYRAQVPRDLRKYIGHWSQEETADTYTREHAIIVTKIWNHIFDNYDATLAKTQPTAPLEPSDPYYLGDLPEPNNVHLIKFDLDARRVQRSRKRQQEDAPAPLMLKKPKAAATPPQTDRSSGRPHSAAGTDY